MVCPTAALLCHHKDWRCQGFSRRSFCVHRVWALESPSFTAGQRKAGTRLPHKRTSARVSLSEGAQAAIAAEGITEISPTCREPFLPIQVRLPKAVIHEWGWYLVSWGCGGNRAELEISFSFCAVSSPGLFENALLCGAVCEQLTRELSHPPQRWAVVAQHPTTLEHLYLGCVGPPLYQGQPPCKLRRPCLGTGRAVESPPLSVIQTPRGNIRMSHGMVRGLNGVGG